MNFKEFESIVKQNTQDTQSKLPSTFTDWQRLINQAVLNLSNELKGDVEIETPINAVDQNSTINIDAGLIMSIVYDVCEMLSNDINIKQKFIQQRNDVVYTHLWNLFKEQQTRKI